MFDASGEFEFDQRGADRTHVGVRRAREIVDRNRRRAEQGVDARADAPSSPESPPFGSRAGSPALGAALGSTPTRMRRHGVAAPSDASELEKRARATDRARRARLRRARRGWRRRAAGRWSLRRADRAASRARRSTSRPCSAAKRAVISEPEPRAASTMITPSARPETRRLRRGKSRPRGSHSSGISETIAPYSAMRGSSGDGLGRIGLRVAAGEHADRAGLQRGDMGALVDAAREAGDDDVARLAEAAREPVGESQAGGRGVARADDRDGRLLQALPRGRATRGSAARRRSAAAPADIPARQGR